MRRHPAQRLLSPRPSLLNATHDARPNSSPQKLLDLKRLKQRAAAIPPIILDSLLEGTLQSGSAKPPASHHALALYQQQITKAHESAREDSAPSKPLPPQPLAEKEPPLSSSPGAPSTSPTVVDKEDVRGAASDFKGRIPAFQSQKKDKRPVIDPLPPERFSAEFRSGAFTPSQSRPNLQVCASSCHVEQQVGVFTREKNLLSGRGCCRAWSCGEVSSAAA
ncbi:UNVERIFIED_CONTAM: hypothetical protein K2H54_010262 [Gekko kuhli]